MSEILDFSIRTNPRVRLLVAGDFNVHFNKTDDYNAMRVTQLFWSFGFTQLINEATHNKGNCLDNIFSNFLVNDVDNVVMSFSDHKAQIVKIGESVVEEGASMTRRYSQNEYSDFMRYLSLETWQDVYGAGGAELKYENFHTAFHYYYDVSFALKPKSSRNKYRGDQ